jgi:hypothetical protein
VIGHHTLRDGEAETGALPRRLGREERIEDPAENLVRDARAFVLELHLDLVAEGARADRETAASVHGLEPVGGDAEEHLAELPLVDDGHRQLARELGDELRAREARLMREQLHGLEHEGVQIARRAPVPRLAH